eukprot:2485256-Amphidinium_carterae.1
MLLTKPPKPLSTLSFTACCLHSPWFRARGAHQQSNENSRMLQLPSQKDHVLAAPVKKACSSPPHVLPKQHSEGRMEMQFL